MAYTFYAKVDRSELSRCMRQLGAFDGRARLKVEKAIHSGTKAVGRDARQKVPRRTGKLRKSIRTSFKSRTITGTVKAMAPHAHLIELGAKRAIARPKKKKALRIQQFGLNRFAMRAKIPARQARPFMKPAYDANEQRIIEDVKKAVQK